MLLKQQRELIELGLVTREQLAEAMHSDTGKKYGILQAILEMDDVDGDAVLSALARNYKVPYVDIRAFKLNPEAIKRCDAEMCLRFSFVPLDVMDDQMVIATDNPFDIPRLDGLRDKLGMRIKLVFTRPDLLRAKLREIYPEAMDSLDLSGGRTSKQSQKQRSIPNLEQAVNAPSIVRLVNSMVIQAIKSGSSDIQVEPGKRKSIVSLSVGGKLRPSLKFPASVHQAVVARIKMMARLDMARSDMPQKGRTRINLWGKRHELIISAIPDAAGESIAIHIQDAADTPAIKAATQSDRVARPDDQAARKREDKSPQAAKQTSSRAESRDKPLILVVDDSSSVRNLVQFVLKTGGYDVLQAADGQEAWDMVQDIKPSLIVADCEMPKMTGPELVRRLREQSRFNETPIVLLTSKTNEEDEVLGLEVGADDYIGKPIEPVKLLARIKKTLAMYSRVSQARAGGID